MQKLCPCLHKDKSIFQMQMEVQPVNEHQSLLAEFQQRLDAEKERANTAEALLQAEKERADTAEQTIKTVQHRYATRFGKYALYRSVFGD